MQISIPNILESYHIQPDIWDELMNKDGVRNVYNIFIKSIESISAEEMSSKDELAKKLFMTQGITFDIQ